jgi:hypothetical protein
MSHRLRINNPKAGMHFMEATFADMDIDPTLPRVQPEWTSRIRRNRTPDEIQLNDQGRITLGEGTFAIRITGELAAPGLRPVEGSDWLVQVYLVDADSKRAVGTLQLSRLGVFSKLITVSGNRSLVWTPQTCRGKVKRTSPLLNRKFQSGDLIVTNLQVRITNVSLDEADEVDTPPEVEVAPI